MDSKSSSATIGAPACAGAEAAPHDTYAALREREIAVTDLLLLTADVAPADLSAAGSANSL